MKKAVLALSIVVLVSLAGSSQPNLSISSSDISFEEDGDLQSGQWEIQFSADEADNLEFDTNYNSELVVDSVEYYNNGWNSIDSDNNLPLNFNWPENAERGRIVLNATSFQDFSGNLTSGSGDQIEIESNPSLRQDQTMLNLDELDPSYTLCGFKEDFRFCNPDSNEPGSSGDTIQLDNYEEKTIEIPSSSEVTSFNLEVSSIDNKSIRDLEGGNMLFADIEGDSNSEAVIYNDKTIKVYSMDGQQLQSYTTDYSINDITAGPVIHQDVVDNRDDLVVSTENSLLVLNENEVQWRISGEEFDNVATGEVSSDRRITQLDDGTAESMQCIGCSTGEDAVFNIPGNVNESREVFYLNLGLNYINQSQDLTLNIGDETYPLNTDSLTEDNLAEKKNEDGNIDQIVEVGGEKVTLGTPEQRLNAETQYLKIPVSKSAGSEDGYLNVTLGDSEYSFDTTNIDQSSQREESTNYNELNSLVQIQDGLEYDLGDLNEDRSSYISLPLNRHPAENTGDLELEINNNIYDVDTSSIDAQSIEEYQGDSGNAVKGLKVADNNAEFNLFYDVPEDIEAENLYIKTGLARLGDNPGNLTLNTGNETYETNISGIETDSSEEYSIYDDNTSDERFCIGCETETEPEFDISAFNTDKYGETLDLAFNICRVGESKELEIGGPGTDNTYPVNTSDIISCEEGSEWENVTVNGSSLTNNYLQFRCDDCNSSNHYSLGLDNSTNGAHSRIYNDSINGYNQDLPGDFLVKLETESALDYEFVTTKIDADNIEPGSNITYSCDGCDEDNGYRIMLDDTSSGDTWDNGEPVEGNMISRVWTNTSLERDTVKTRVDTEDLLAADNISINCVSCEEGYNIVSDKDATGHTFRDGNQLDRNAGVKILQYPLDHEWINIPISMDDQLGTAEFESNTTVFLGLDSESSVDASKNGKVFDSGSTARLWSNRSLEYEELRVEVDGSVLANNTNATVSCESCENPGYNLMIDDSSNLDSWRDGSEKVNGGYIVSQESFGSNLGGEIAASQFPSELVVFNSTGDQLWNNSLDAQVEDIEIGDVDDSTGNEVVAATRNGLHIAASTGDKLRGYPENGDEWIRSIELHNSNVIAGSDEGNLTSIDSSNNVLWEENLGSRITSMTTGNLVKEVDDSLAVGESDGSVEIYDLNGNRITGYARENSIGRIDTGSTNAMPGDLVGLSTDEIEILDLYSLPENMQINLGSDTLVSQNGYLRGSTEVGDVSLLNNDISECSNATCEIPVTFESDSPAKLNISNIEIGFNYDINSLIDSADGKTNWEKTSNIQTGQAIRNTALEINYTENPEIPVQVNRIISDNIESSIDGSKTNITLNNATFENPASPSIDLESADQEFIFPTLGEVGQDTIWYDDSTTGTPVSSSSTELDTSGSLSEKNVTVSRNTDLTDTVFRNVTTEITLNESEIQGGQFVEVNWKDNGFVDITPEDEGCTRSSTHEVNGDTFQTCLEDEDNDDIAETLQIVQPQVGVQGSNTGETTYRVGGTSNYPPTVDNLTVSPIRSEWNTTHEVNVSFDDDNANVAATLWIETGNGWNQTETKDNGLEHEFNFTTDKEWTGERELLIEYTDLDENGDSIRPSINSSSQPFTVEKRPLEIEITDGPSNEKDRIGESEQITALVRDANTGNTVDSSEALCYLNMEAEAAHDIQATNENGQCTLQIGDLEEASLGSQNWSIEARGQNYYLDTTTDTQNIQLNGNYDYTTSLSNTTIYLPNNYGLTEQSSLEINNIQDLTGEERNPSYEVTWIGTETDSGETSNNQLTAETVTVDGTSPGTYNLAVELSGNNFNTATIIRDITVQDSFESNLSSSKNVIDKSENINLTAEFIRSENNEEVTVDSIDYNTPPGYCSTEYVDGNTYTCEFVPASDLESGEYTWSVDASKENNKHIAGSDTFEIAGDIVADIEFEQSELSRSPEGQRTNTLDYTIDNVTDESGAPLNDVNYTLSINNEQVAEGDTGNDNTAQDSYTIEETQQIGVNDVSITIESNDKRLIAEDTVTVYGKLDINLTSTENEVYLSNSITDSNSSLNTITQLETNVENQQGGSVQNTDISFNTPDGTCNQDGNNCDFTPSVDLNPGNYTWNATADAEYYEPATSESNNITVKDVVSLGDITETVEANFSEQTTIDATLENPLGQTVSATGFEAVYNGQTTEITDSSAAITFTPQCQNYNLGSQTETVQLTGNSEFYTIYSNEETFELDVFNTLNLNIASPLDSSNPDAENYRQGDSVDLQLDITPECSIETDNYEVVWRAASEEESSIISSGQTSTWTIEDRFSGPTDITAEVDNNYYHNNIETNEIVIDRVLNNDITSHPDEFTRQFNQDHTAEFETTIKTGQGELANESNINENWSDFEVIWYVNGNQQTVTNTNENGVSTATLDLGSSYSIGDVNIEAELRNTTNIDTRILQNTDTETTTLLDESRITITEPSSPTDVFYTDEISLDSSLEFATTNNPDNIQDLNIAWSYEGPLTDGDATISSSQQTSWTIPSYVYGDGNLKASVDAPLIQADQTSISLIGKREVSLTNFEISEYLQPNSTNTINADISVDGLEDKSGYTVELWRGSYGQDTTTAETNQDGVAELTWDTNDYSQGAYDTGIRIFDNESLYFETQEPSELNETVIIPEVLNISAHYRDNQERDSRDETFENLDKHVVYRNGGPWKHPETLYLAANVTTPFQDSEQRYEVENSTVQFWIEGESAEGETITEKIGEDTVNLTEYEQGQNDNENQWWDEYLAHTEWDPRGEFPVGDYDLKINATHPQESFEPEPVTNVPVEVRGTLNITITEPTAGRTDYQMDNTTMSAIVEDMNGNEFTASELDEVHWTLEEDTCANTNDDGSTSGGAVMNWDDAIAHGERSGTLSTWMIMGNTGNYNINGNEMIWVNAEKEFFDTTRNSYRTGFTGCSSVFHQWRDTPGELNSQYEGDRDDRVGQYHDVISRVEAFWNAPSQTTVGTNDNDMLNVSARFYEYNTSQGLPNGFNGQFHATCVNCTDGQNKDLTQSAGEFRDESEAQFKFNFSEENYGQNYTIKIWATSNDKDWETPYPLNTTSKRLEIYRDIGSGEGEANINGECEPNEGENVEVAPSDCGYDNLDPNYWLNETATSLNEEDLAGLEDNDSRVIQYNRFANESHPDYEAGVRYYGEHSMYDDNIAGGCDFDGETSGEQDDIYEARNHCPDWTIEEEPPEIQDIEVTPGYFLTDQTEQNVWTKIDAPNENLDIVQLQTADGEVIDSDMSLSGSTSYPREFETNFIPTTNSDNDYNIVATTQEGLQAEQGFTVIHDDGNTEVGSITIEDPLIPYSYSGNKESISASINFGSIDAQGIKRVTADVSGAGITELDHQGEGTYTGDFEPTDTGGGTGEVTVKAEMKAGYNHSLSTTYNLNMYDPVVSNFNITPDPVSNGDEISLSADLEDSDNALSSVEVTKNQGGTICEETESDGSGILDCTTNVAETGTGIFTYTATATDTAGRTGNSTFDLEIDNNAPEVTVNSYDEVIQSGESTTIDAAATDNENNLESFEVINLNDNTIECSNNGLGGVNENSISCTVSPTQNTNYKIQANDSVQNTNSQTIEILTVEEPPNITFDNLNDGDLVNGDINVDVLIDDPDNALDTSTPYLEVIDNSDNIDYENSLSGDGNNEIWTDSIDTNSLTDGAYTLNASASDRGGLFGSSQIEIEIDNTPPSISFDTLDVVSGTKNLGATITDANHGSSYSYTIESNSGTGSNTGSLTSPSADSYETGDIDTTNFDDGDATFEITATDAAGNTQTDSTQFNIDNNPPVINIQSPTSGTHVRNTFTVEAEIFDEAGNEDPASYECRVGEATWQSMNSVSGNTYDCSIDSTSENNGATSVEVRASDTEGQTNTNSRDITIDNEAPDITDVTLGNTIVNSGITIDVTSTVSDNQEVNTVTADSETLTHDGSGNWTGTITSTGTHGDTNSVTVEAEDRAGNIQTNTNAQYTIDDQAPDFTGRSIDQSYIQTGDQVVFDVTIDEEHLVQDSVQIEVVDSDDTVVNTLDNSCTFNDNTHSCSPTWDGTQEDGSNALDGNYRFRTTAKDAADNSNTEIYSEEVTVDNTNPQFSNFDNSKDYIQEDETVTFSVNVDEQTFDDSQTQITVMDENGAVATPTTTCQAESGNTYSCSVEWNATAGEYSEGEYYPEISSTDLAGNSNTGSDQGSSVYLDPQDPQIERQEIIDANTVFQSSQQINLEVEATDNTFVKDIIADGENLTQNNGIWDGSINPASSEGTYPITIEVIDAAANSITSQNLEYEVDNTNPSISGLTSNATDGVSRSDAMVEFEVTASDTNLDTVTLEGQQMTHESGDIYTLVTTPADLSLTEGSNSLTATATDLAENTASTGYNLDVDDGNPQISDIELSDQILQSGSDLTVSSRVVDDHLENVTLKHKGSDHEMTVTDGDVYQTTVQTSGSNEEIVTLNITALDKAGNIAWDDTTNYQIDDEAPNTGELLVAGSNSLVTTSSNSSEFEIDVTDNIQVASVELLTGSGRVSLQNTESSIYAESYSPADLSCPTGQDYTECEIGAIGTDEAGNTDLASSNVSLFVDDVAPSINSYTANNSIVQTGTTVLFEADVTDGDNQITNTVTGPSGNQLCEMEGQSCEATVSETGEYTLTSSDRAGNTKQDSVTITIDDTAPDIGQVNINASYDASRSDDNILYTVSVTEDNLDTVYIPELGSDQQHTLTHEENSEYSLTSTPAELGCTSDVNNQTCSLEIISEDLAGNTASQPFEQTIDDQQPEITSVYMEETVLQSNSDVFVSVEANNEDSTTLNLVEAEPEANNNNNLTWSEENGNWTGTIQIDNDGQLDITATDYAGNQGTDSSQTYTVDDTPPSISEFDSNATENISRSNSTLEFSLNAQDSQEIDNVKIGTEGNLNEITGDGTTYTTEATPAELGCSSSDFQTCTVLAEATDIAGNTGTEQYELTIDDHTPEITDISLNDTIFRSGASVETIVEIEGEDSDTIDSVEAQNNILDWMESESYWEATITPEGEEEGEYTLPAEATDYANNTGHDNSQNYIIDNTPPQIENLQTNSSDGIETSDTVLNYTVDVADANGIQNVSINGQEMSSLEDNTYELITTPNELNCSEEGTCLLNATVYDNAEWSNQTNHSITIDNSAPTIDDYVVEGVIEGDPYDAALPTFDLNWTINTSSLSQTEAEIYATNSSTGEQLGESFNLNKSNNIEGAFYRELQPRDMNATGGLISFIVNVTDEAGNLGQGNYTLNLDTVPPNVQDVDTNITNPETTRETVELQANITHNVEVAQVNATITSEENASFEKELEMTLPEENEAENNAAGVFVADFVPPHSGNYDVNIYARDEFDEYDDTTFEDVFTAIGKTNLDISMTPEISEFDSITTSNKGNLLVETIVTNTGEVTAYNTEIPRLSPPEGTETNSSTVQCGDLAAGESCSTTTQVNFTVFTSPGTRNIIGNSYWENPDRESEINSDIISTNVLENPVLEVTSPNSRHYEDVFYGETGEINLTVTNQGNTPLENIQSGTNTIAIDGSNALSGGDIDVNERNISVGESSNTTINILDTLDKKGRYITSLDLDVSEEFDNCGSNCLDTAEFTIDLFRRSFVEIENEPQTLYRNESLNLVSSVTDEEDNGTENYPVELGINETNLGETDTDQNGEVSTEVQIANFQPGVYNVTAEIEDQEDNYYRTGRRLDSKQFEIRDKLNIESTYSDTSLFWYETTNDDDQIDIQYNVTDVNGQPVANANVTLLSNATTEDDSYEVKEYGLTNENGSLNITYQTDRDSPGNASLKTLVDKNSFYDTPEAETQPIQIEGGFSVRIVNIEDNQNILRNQDKQITAEITDDSGATMDPGSLANITWTLNNTELTDGNGTNQFTWNIPADQDTGTYELTIEAEDDGSDTADNEGITATDTKDIEMYEAINLQSTSVSTEVANRKDSEINFTATVTDSNGNNVASYSGCKLFVEGSEINQSQTDSNGDCVLNWNTNESSKVGNNLAEVLLTKEKEGDTWYLPNNTVSEQFEILLEEEINLELVSPRTDFYKHENYTLEADTTDAYDRELETNVSWYVDEEFIGANQTTWNTENASLGNNLLNVTSENPPYNSTYLEKTIRLFGRSAHELQTDTEVSRGENAGITVNVSDVNTSSPIEGYTVSLYRTNPNNVTEFWENITTNSEGIATKSWDTSDADLGEHTVTAELQSSETLHYNSTTHNLTENIYVGGEINTEVTEITETELYRDQLSEPFTTNISTNSTNDIGNSLSNVTNTLVINNQTVEHCTTAEDGLCQIKWNPDSETSIGNLTGYINSSSENYFANTSQEFNIEVRTGSKPELDVSEEAGYNFSKDEGIPINVSVLESFTDQPVANYSFDLGWGTRSPVEDIYTTESDWEADNTSRINGTENHLEITNTTAFRTFEDLNSIDRTIIEVAKDEGTIWNITLDTEEGEIQKTTNESKVQIDTDNTTVNQINISTNDSINITDGELGTLKLDNRRELMTSELLGSETGTNTDRGDFVNASVRQTIGDNPGGWYVDSSDSVETSLASGTFGTPSLQLSLEEFSQEDTATVIREYSNRDGSDAYEDFEILEFWINSELNSTLTINGEACSQDYNVSTASWSPVQLNLTDYHNNCGEKIERIELDFQNTGEEPVTTEINVDQFRRYKSANTTENGSQSLSWLPPEAGEYSFRLDIEDAEYFNTTENTVVSDLEVLSTGGGDSATDSEEQLPEGGGIADNFEIKQDYINQTVGLNTYGTLNPITVENIGTEPINISTGFPAGSDTLKANKGTIIEPNQERQIELEYTTEELGEFVTEVAVYDEITGKREDIPVNLTVAPMEIEILNVEAKNQVTNITPGDNITVESQVRVDGEPVNESIDWSTEIGDTQCSNLDQSYDNTSESWITSCKAPSIDYNPLEPQLESVASYNGIELRDNRTVGYRDITGPFVEDKDAENIEQGETTDISVTAWDNTEITSVEGHVEYLENNSNIGNIDFDNTEDDFYNTSIEIGENRPEGDYDAVVNLTDENNNVRTVRVPFSVHPFVEVEGNTTPGTTFSFNRPGTNTELESITTENESYNFSVQNRTYDTSIETDTVNEAGNNQRQEIRFNDSEINDNLTDPINITGGDTGENVAYEHPPQTTNMTFSHVSYSTGFNYSAAEVTLDYSNLGSSPDELPEEDFSVYRCPADDATKCGSSNWTKLDTTVNTSIDTATAQTGTSSTYILAREVTDDGENDNEGGEDGQENEEESGGGGPVLGPSIGGPSDGEQEGGEGGNEPFSITPRIYHPVMERGETQTYFLEIINNRQNETGINLSIDGEISDLIAFAEETVYVPGESASVTEMTVSIPADIPTGNYDGNITAQYQNFSTTSNHQILVESEGQGEIELDTTVLTQTLQPGQNMTYNVEIGQTNLETPINATIEHYIRKSDTDEVMHYFNETQSVNEGSSLQREVDMSGQDLGNYYVQSVLTTDDTVVSSSDTFMITEGFWTPFRRRAVMLILLTLLVTVSSWKGYQKYWERKESESRYVFPVDYSKLPEESEDNFWTGKIAETDKDAFIDPKDLTTHTIVSGSTGSGKSVTANIIAEEALENDIPVIVFDPTAQWTGFVKELKDDNLMDHYSRFGMNETEDPHPYRGTIKEIDSEDPDIDFQELKEPGEITVFTLNQLTTEEFDQAVRKIIDQIFDEEWEESPELEMLVVFDEVHRLLEEYGGQGGYHALEKGAREFRKWGIGLMMASQVTADFKQAISGNIMTEVQMQTKSMSDIDRIETKYGEEFAKRISSEDIGVGMVQNSNYNDGEPWFVDFRPTYHNPHKIPDEELEKYHNLSKELSKLKDTLEEKEDAGEDIRDKKLELQLAENKLKEGRFKMANMYINSLKDEMDIE